MQNLFIYISIFYLFTYLFIYLLMCGPTQLEGSPFGWLLNPGMLRIEGVS